MKKENQPCQEDMDLMQHRLIEQITQVCVQEEEERMREEQQSYKG